MDDERADPGMGYGPCARGLGHWDTCQERGRIFGVWNMSHNVGGGAVGIVAAWCAHHYGWPSAFYVPGLIATLGAFYLFLADARHAAVGRVASRRGISK